MSQCSGQGHSLIFLQQEKYNSYRYRLIQEREHGDNGSKQQNQPCSLVPPQALGEAARCSVPSSHPGGALCHVNGSPVSFGSRLLLECDHTFSVNIVLLITVVEMDILLGKLSAFIA